jgi:hypothetical protein
VKSDEAGGPKTAGPHETRRGWRRLSRVPRLGCCIRVIEVAKPDHDGSTRFAALSRYAIVLFGTNR